MTQLTALVVNSPWAVLAFIFVLGAVIGSFLNVVVYRLPAGMNLMHPASRCPQCGKPIRWYDNVPILGWLLLRGKCRDCGEKISPRYPMVEFLVGIIFFTFCWIDVVTPAAVADPALVDAQMQTFCARFVFHLLLLCPLLAAALIDADGHRLPRRLITWPAAVGALLAFGMPAVQVMSVNFANHADSEMANFWALANSMVGLVAAVTIRLMTFSLIGYQRPRELGLLSATLALYAVGAFLGWQAAVAIGLAMAVWTAFSQISNWRQSLSRLQPTAVVFAAALVWCACERIIAARI